MAQASACAAQQAPVDPAYRPGSLGRFLTIIWRGPAKSRGVEVSLQLTASLFLPRFCCLIANTFQRTPSCPPNQPRLGAVEPMVPVPLGSWPRPRAPPPPGTGLQGPAWSEPRPQPPLPPSPPPPACNWSLGCAHELSLTCRNLSLLFGFFVLFCFYCFVLLSLAEAKTLAPSSTCCLGLLEAHAAFTILGSLE